jgi:hypothetical protein
MKKKFKIIKNEIYLSELVGIIWNGKWKIVMSIAIASIFAYTIQTTQKIPVKMFSATTQILPINTLEEQKYSAFNDYFFKVQNTNNFFENYDGKKNLQITKEQLLNLYIKILNELNIFKFVLHEQNFLDISKYSDEALYYEDIAKIASKIKIYFPSKVNNQTDEQKVYSIKFDYHDARKWKFFLIRVNELTNAAVKLSIQKNFEVLVFSEKIRINYELEDLSIKKENLIKDYEREISDRVAYLKEQAAIAKKLGIAKNTIEVQTFGNQNTLFSNVKTEAPFYLRGYEAINKEIELVLSRTNKEAFISGLIASEQKTRKFKQDRSLERLNFLFEKTPLSLVNTKEFVAAKLAITIIKDKSKYQKKFMIQGILIGLIIGLLYTFISYRHQLQKTLKKKNN